MPSNSTIDRGPCKGVFRAFLGILRGLGQMAMRKAPQRGAEGPFEVGVGSGLDDSASQGGHIIVIVDPCALRDGTAQLFSSLGSLHEIHVEIVGEGYAFGAILGERASPGFRFRSWRAFAWILHSFNMGLGF